jgi:hypothetical protein
MRSILTLTFLIALLGSVNAAAPRHTHHSRHNAVASDPASGFAYAPGPATGYRTVPFDQSSEPYPGASQGYAPGERERVLDSVRRGG